MSLEVLACTVCLGAADGVMLTAARGGVLVMVAITCAMLAGFAAFFVRLARKGHNPDCSQEEGTA